MLESKLEPAVFSFNHNGIILSAQQEGHADGFLWMIGLRLNGAQTVTTPTEFLKVHVNSPALAANRSRLDEIKVLCRITAPPIS